MMTPLQTRQYPPMTTTSIFENRLGGPSRLVTRQENSPWRFGSPGMLNFTGRPIIAATIVDSLKNRLMFFLEILSVFGVV